jgi:hypothetical protein
MPSFLEIRYIFIQIRLMPFPQLWHIVEPEEAYGLRIGMEAAVVQFNELPPQY